MLVSLNGKDKESLSLSLPFYSLDLSESSVNSPKVFTFKKPAIRFGINLKLL